MELRVVQVEHVEVAHDVTLLLLVRFNQFVELLLAVVTVYLLQRFLCLVLLIVEDEPFWALWQLLH